MFDVTPFIKSNSVVVIFELTATLPLASETNALLAVKLLVAIVVAAPLINEFLKTANVHFLSPPELVFAKPTNWSVSAKDVDDAKLLKLTAI